MKSLLVILLFYTTAVVSQDTLFICRAYEVYYSFYLKAPIYAKYKLYKGGGDCDRNGFHFNNLEMGNRTANASDYHKSGYDMGHLVNAEDFAYDCELDEMTFRFWNCFPQTPALNRGIWNKHESEIRQISQEDSLIILCGGIYNNRTIGSGVAIPDKCWKVVYSLSTKQIISTQIFHNTENPTTKSITINKLNRLMLRRYKINLISIIEG